MKQLFCSILVACLPLRHLSLTSPFGFRIHPVTGKYSFHAGVDLSAHSDTVFAVLPGTVEAEGFDPFLGIYVRLRQGDIQTIYGHLSQLFVFKGDSVQLNNALGITGQTGRVTGEHLHFSVSYHGQYIDPLLFLYKILILQHPYANPDTRTPARPGAARRLPRVDEGYSRRYYRHGLV